MHRRLLCRALLIAVPALTLAAPLLAHAPDAVPAGSRAFARLLDAHLRLVPTPTYARQTGLACTACHTQFPELTRLGRTFKLNGYVRRKGDKLEGKSDGQTTLLLGYLPPVSFMVQPSFTEMGEALPDDRNGTVLLPQQVSLFTGGEITPQVGAFVQVTYDGIEGSVSLDNTDIRFARPDHAFGKTLTWGISLNNAPTVQDLWNSTPVWGFPYASSPIAPTPVAAPILAGELDQQVAGLTALGMFADLLYLEGGVYTWAPTGVDRPVAEDEPGTIEGVAPYWRAVVQHNWTHDYAHIGTYGLVVHQPVGAPAPAEVNDRLTDVAIDASWFHRFGRANSLSTHVDWIHESVEPGFVPVGVTTFDRSVDLFRFDATYFHEWWLGVTAAPFWVWGTTAPTVFTPGGIEGSRTGSPDSNGLIGQLSLMPWQNTKFTFQYTAYFRFNGSGDDYNGTGRNASDNNNFYFVIWFLF